LFVTNADPTYGLLFGSLTNGNSYLQSQRVDGTATTYNLLLNPNGGNVGIGTVSPTHKLQVSSDVQIGTRTSSPNLGENLNVNGYSVLSGAGGAFANWYDSTGGTNDKWGRLIFTNGVFSFQNVNDAYSVGSETMRITDTGNVGIGSSVPDAKLLAVGGANTGIHGNSTSFYGVYGDSGSSVGVLGISASSYAVLGQSTTGFGGYFTTGVGSAVNIALGGVNLNTGTQGYIGYGGVGVYCAAGACGGVDVWTNYSDQRLKKDVNSLATTSGLDSILKLNPVTFN
jgi:hypothetical protein